MDRNTCKDLRPALQKLLDESDLANRYEVTVGSASYDDVQATFKITLKDAGAKTHGQDFAEREAERLGLKLVSDNGARIVDYNFKAPKYPWIVEKADGRRYKYPDSLIKREFAA
jgi:hypothetical protein